jgi:dihydrofolate reductase
MRVTLMNAVSLDGFIARTDGRTDWVVDFDFWEKEVKKVKAMIVGRRTFDELQSEGLWDDVTYFVLTGSLKEHKESNVECCWSPDEAIEDVKKCGFNHVLLCGGAESNSEFATLGLINDVIIDVHPILLGEGKSLLGGFTGGLQLKDSQTVKHDGFTQITATVVPTK